MSRMSEKAADPALPLEGGVTPEAQGLREPGQVTATEARPRSKALVAPSQPISEHQALLAMISAAAANPKVNVDKLERLMAMRDRAVAAQKEQDFNDAMMAAQQEMAPVRADANNPSTKSKYATYAALDRALRPIYTKHGFGLSFDTEDCPKPDHERIVCYLTAKGHTRKPHIDMPTDGKGARGGDVMTKTHAAGSGVSYGMRYLLKMIFNIAVFDDDGNAAGKTAINDVDDSVPKITEAQVLQLREKCDSVGASWPNFLKWAKVKRFEDIPADLYAGCVQGLDDFKKSK